MYRMMLLCFAFNTSIYSFALSSGAGNLMIGLIVGSHLLLLVVIAANITSVVANVPATIIYSTYNGNQV